MFLKGFKIFSIVFFLFSFNLLINYQVYANELKFTKIINLNSPWGMTFKNENELNIHKTSFNKIKKILKKRHPTLKIELLLMSLDKKLKKF